MSTADQTQQPQPKRVLKASARVKCLSDIMEMMEVWGRPELLELSQQLVYSNVAKSPDEELLHTHDTFVGKTNEMLAKRKEEEDAAAKETSEDASSKTEVSDNGPTPETE